MQVGGLPVLAEEEVQGLLHEVFLLYLVLLSLLPIFHCAMTKPGLCDRSHFVLFLFVSPVKVQGNLSLCSIYVEGCFMCLFYL